MFVHEILGETDKGQPWVAYHGTPHTFDRFDLSKIGSGEGAQVYGYGFYFAEMPEVADHYYRALAKPSEGHVITVRIHATPDEMLDWNKPLLKQSPRVRATLNSIISEMYRGGSPRYIEAKVGDGYIPSLYQDMASKYGAVGASKKLQDAGIKGIRYLDQGSRGGSSASYNIVIFDPADVEMTHRDGQPLTPPSSSAH